MVRDILQISILFLLFTLSVYSSDYFEEFGEFQGNEYITPAEGFSKAIENARRKILEKAGIHVKEVNVLASFSTLKDVKEYFSSIIQTYSQAVITDEKILWKDLDKDKWVYRVKIRTKGKIRERESFSIDAYIAKSGLGKVENPVLNSGEEIQIYALSNTSCWFWIFWVDRDDNVIPIFPNEQIKQKGKSSEILFPDEYVRKRIGKLYVEANEKSSIEKIFVFAILEDIDLIKQMKMAVERERKEIGQKVKPKIYHLFSALAELNSNWAVEPIIFEVKR